MDNRIKILIGALIGAGVGLLAGNLIVNEIRASEWDEDDYFEVEYGEDYEDEDDPESLNDEPIERKSRIVAQKSKRVRNYGEYFIGQDRPDLAALAAKYNGDNTQDVTPEENPEDQDTKWVDEDATNPNLTDADPSVISSTEFINSDTGYERVVLYYYSDDVVTDEDDNPVNRPEQLIGDDALVSFGEQSDNPNMVYIRNKAKHAEYHIIRIDAPYAPEEPTPNRRNHSGEKRVQDDQEDDE